MSERFDPERFLTAQQGVHEQALEELRAGRKRSHWMWFVFPQIAGLGTSPTARHYAIGSLAEARAYLAHPVLGARLREAASVAAAAPATSAAALLGPIDVLKLRSSMTLFGRADPQQPVFRQVLDRWYDGEEDPATLQRL